MNALRPKRLWPWLLLHGTLLTLLIMSGCGRPQADTQPTRANVWAYAREIAPQVDLPPHLIYAIVEAESTFDPFAESPSARGIMQLGPLAWQEVTEDVAEAPGGAEALWQSVRGKSYRQAWNWQTNMKVGALYLAFCREKLQERGRFSYPLLVASYRYGPYYVRSQGYRLDALRPPKNRIYRELFAGNLAPVPLPLQ